MGVLELFARDSEVGAIWLIFGVVCIMFVNTVTQKHSADGMASLVPEHDQCQPNILQVSVHD